MWAIGGCVAQQDTLPPDAHLSGLSWMSGSWMSNSDGGVVEEQWTPPRGGTMFGVNRTVHDNETSHFEYLCIQHTQDGIYYMASPKGRQPPTPFKLVQLEGTTAIFENLEHDFPQRIIYRRQRDMMRARIEGTRRGELAFEEWTWRLAN